MTKATTALSVVDTPKPPLASRIQQLKSQLVEAKTEARDEAKEIISQLSQLGLRAKDAASLKEYLPDGIVSLLLSVDKFADDSHKQCTSLFGRGL